MISLLLLALQIPEKPYYVSARVAEQEQPSFVRTEVARCQNMRAMVSYRSAPNNTVEVGGLSFNQRIFDSTDFSILNKSSFVRKARFIKFVNCDLKFRGSLGLQIIVINEIIDDKGAAKQTSFDRFFLSEKGVVEMPAGRGEE